MIRKLLILLVLSIGFLLIISTIGAARNLNGPRDRTGIATSTPALQAGFNSLSKLPLSGTQTGAHSIMSGMRIMGAGMSGMNKSGLSMTGANGMALPPSP